MTPRGSGSPSGGIARQPLSAGCSRVSVISMSRAERRTASISGAPSAATTASITRPAAVASCWSPISGWARSASSCSARWAGVISSRAARPAIRASSSATAARALLATAIRRAKPKRRSAPQGRRARPVSLTQREERPSPSVRDEVLTTEEVCALLKSRRRRCIATPSREPGRRSQRSASTTAGNVARSWPGSTRILDEVDPEWAVVRRGDNRVKSLQIVKGPAARSRRPRWCPRGGVAPSLAAGRAWPRSGLAAASITTPRPQRRAASGAGQLSVGQVGFGAAGVRTLDHGPASLAPRTSMDHQHPVGQGSSGVARPRHRPLGGHPHPRRIGRLAAGGDRDHGLHRRCSRRQDVAQGGPLAVL